MPSNTPTTAQQNAIRVVGALLHEQFGPKPAKARKLAKLLEWRRYAECGICDVVMPIVRTTAGDECLLCGSDDLSRVLDMEHP